MLKQVYYTSCSTGLRGGAGFQVNAATPGLDEPTLALIERYSGYQPPLALAYARGTDPADFPRSLSFYRIAPLTAVVSRSVYLGSSGTDARGGNFFTHSLVSQQGSVSFGALIPVQLWEAACWNDQPAPTTELPEAAPPAPNPALNLATVEQFLHATPRRLDLLAPLIETVIACVAQQRRLIIVAPAPDCANWIAAVTLALPRSLAYQCTFTTYTRAVDLSPCTIVGVEPSCFETWGHQQTHPEWVVFAPPAEIASTIPLGELPAASFFAAFAAGAYRERETARIESFVAMADGLRSVPECATLDHLAALHHLANGLPVDDQRLFALAHFSPTLLDEPPTTLHPLLAHLEQLDPQTTRTYEAVGKMLASAHAQPAAASSAAVLQWGAVWIESHFLPRAAPNALLAMGMQLATLRPPPAAWSAFAPTLRSHLHNATDHLNSFAAVPGQPAAKRARAAILLAALISLVEGAALVEEMGNTWQEALQTLATSTPAEEHSAHILASVVERQVERSAGSQREEEQAYTTIDILLQSIPAALEGGQPSLRQHIARSVAGGLLRSAPSAERLEHTLRSLSTHEAALWEGFAAWLRQQSREPRQEDEAAWFVALVSALAPLRRIQEGQQTPALAILRDPLRAVWESFGRKEQKTIEQTIKQRSNDTTLQAGWKAWRSAAASPWFRFWKK